MAKGLQSDSALKVVSVSDFCRRLEPLLEEEPGGAVVFDADGTLWSHDVGCMVFDYAVQKGAFGEEAFLPLRDAAQREGLDVRTASTANDVARAFQAAWYDGKSGERSTAEMQVWAYVGMDERDFRSLCRQALEHGRHEATVHEPVVRAAEWVRSNGGRSLIVSASPLWVVQEAAGRFGFAVEEMAAGTPKTERSGTGRRIQPGLETPLPYGPDKVTAGRTLIGEGSWLATLGDSCFDIDMMRCARLAAGIGDKPDMLRQLADLEHAVLLAF